MNKFAELMTPFLTTHMGQKWPENKKKYVFSLFSIFKLKSCRKFEKLFVLNRMIILQIILTPFNPIYGSKRPQIRKRATSHTFAHNSLNIRNSASEYLAKLQYLTKWTIFWNTWPLFNPSNGSNMTSRLKNLDFSHFFHNLTCRSSVKLWFLTKWA